MSAADVVRGALAQARLYDSGSDPAVRLAFDTAAVVDALTAAGHLPPPGPPPTVEDYARWLAEQSGHVRYCAAPDGWRALLTYRGDVVMAHAAATRRLPGAATTALDTARDALFEFHADRDGEGGTVPSGQQTAAAASPGGPTNL